VAADDPDRTLREPPPGRIRFGEGVLASLPDVLAAEGCSAPFVVIDEQVLAVPGLADVLERIGGTRHEKAAGEPTVDEVESAAARLAESGSDAVVAIGGAPPWTPPRRRASSPSREARIGASRREASPTSRRTGRS